MIITCEECKTSYNLDASQLQPSGTKVRCTNCRHVFTAFPPPEEVPTLVKAEPVADTQFDTPPPQAAADALSDAPGDLEMLDADDLFEIDGDGTFDQDTDSSTANEDEDEFDLASEDFDLPGNNVEFLEGEEPSEADLQLTDDDLDLVMDMAPPKSEAPTDAPDASAAPELNEFDEFMEDIPTQAASDDLNALAADPSTAADLEADLELEGLDLGEEADGPELVATPSAPDLEGTDELDLDLDLDLDLGDDDNETDAAAEAPLEQALSLDDDFSLEDAVASGVPGATASVATDAAASAEEAEDAALDELDIEDLDLELDMDSGDEDNAASDLELEIEDDSTNPVSTEIDAPEIDMDDDDLDFDLDLDLEAENLAATVEADGAEAGDPLLELDLGDTDTDTEDTDAAPGDDDDFALDLDNLDLMDEEAEDSSYTEENELELDFGGDFELAMDDDTAKDKTDEDDLDLADLEGLLDEAETSKAAASDDLVIDEGPLFGEEESGAGGGQEASLDLSELESILDDDEDGGDEGLALDEEPELDLDLESTPTLASDTDDLDLSDFEYLAEDGETAPSDDHFDSGDMELEFQVDDEGASALEEADAQLQPPSTPDQQPAEPEIVPETAPLAPAGPAPIPKKRGTSKLLIAVLIIVLLLGGGYCAYVLLDGMGIRIPYLSDYLKPEANDPGNLQMTTFDINSRFVDSQVLGRIFVITGKVKNGYDHPRGFVQLTGKLFTKGKKLASNQTVYAGNLINDMDLVNLNADELSKRLNNRFGNNRMNSRVQSGKALPFMVVFSQLPEAQLEEFTIEVDTSTALK
jgi:predicted Zn finger-like uncharacterized protein